jgi:hypothetical protein
MNFVLTGKAKQVFRILELAAKHELDFERAVDHRDKVGEMFKISMQEVRDEIDRTPSSRHIEVGWPCPYDPDACCTVQGFHNCREIDCRVWRDAIKNKGGQ